MTPAHQDFLVQRLEGVRLMNEVVRKADRRSAVDRFEGLKKNRLSDYLARRNAVLQPIRRLQ